MIIESGDIKMVIFEKNEIEKKIVKYFLEGMVKLRWNPKLKMAEVIPRIFKVKNLDVMLCIKSDCPFYDYFLELWNEGRLVIYWSKKDNDFITFPSVLKFLELKVRGVSEKVLRKAIDIAIKRKFLILD